MKTLTSWPNQLLATKLFVPLTCSTRISRSRLTTLLDESFKYPLTLISAPAGFGKTTLLTTWIQSLPANSPQPCWISLDEEDNDPQLFWTYLLTAFSQQQPERLAPLLNALQSPHSPPLNYILKALINVLAEATKDFVLILDDYQVITQEEIHTTLSYLVEHLPPQGHILLATRVDPPFSLALLRAHQQILEVCADQLRCTPEETRAFFKEVVGIQLSDEALREVAARTEGWLVGLQLLGLSLRECADPVALLEDVSGDQSYILDYLTEEVLRQQPEEVQTFLLCTCILEQFSAPLCDAVMNQPGSQRLLERLEHANLFVVSLDQKRQWYRYHALFAEALRYHLEQRHADLIPLLHHRASLWYAEHHQSSQAIVHALSAKEWHWAADLIERVPFMSLAWKAGERKSVQLRRWLEHLPTDIVHARPRLCVACAQMLWAVVPQTVLHAWLDAAEATLTASLREQSSFTILTPQARQDQENLLGEVLAIRAWLQSIGEDQHVLPLCQQALSLLSADNYVGRIQIIYVQSEAMYTSVANDAVAAIQSLLQALSLAQAAGQPPLLLTMMSVLARYMIGAGQLHEAQQITQQAMQLGNRQKALVLPEVGWPALFHAEILREWNELDAAHSLAEEALALCKQAESVGSLTYVFFGYAVLLRIFLSRAELHAACSTLQQIERISMNMNQHASLSRYCLFTMIDQVRLWLARGELEHAAHWAKQVNLTKSDGTPFAHERQEVACARVLLATNQPALALQRLEPVLQRATAGQRWGHTIEIRILQALAHQTLCQEKQALSVLGEAVQLAEPEGYIRSFLDEGSPMAALLYQLRKQQRHNEPTPYLDLLLAAFQKEKRVSMQVRELTHVQLPSGPLSKREQEILQLLAHGTSNQEIAQELVLSLNTVKRHVTHILTKLGVQNRVQAAIKARELSMLGKEP